MIASRTGKGAIPERTAACLLRVVCAAGFVRQKGRSFMEYTSDHRENLLLQIALGMIAEEDVKDLTEEERKQVKGMRKRIDAFKASMGEDAKDVTFEVPFD